MIYNNKKVPFLPVRDDFHPKRNQARQKLATLSSNRFRVSLMNLLKNNI